MRLIPGCGPIKILGDPHLGRTFTEGVPLHRRGEREEAVWADFTKSLFDVDGCDFHVMMGDLFNKFTVPARIVLDTADAYLKAAKENPTVDYVVLMGNHDQVRDADKRSSFDIFRALVKSQGNIYVVSEEPLQLYNHLFVPWSPWATAEEMVADVDPGPGKFDAIFGHWDIKSFGGEDSNLCPYEKLSKLTDLIVTGHIHIPEEFTTPFGTRVVVTGSMQPYSHGEDPDGKLYVTLRQDEIDDAGDLKNKCVRILLQPGEEMETEIDCLQLTYKRVKEKEDEDVGEVEIENFDFKGLFEIVMAHAGVDPSVIQKVWGEYDAQRA